MALLKLKASNALINNKPIFNHPIKTNIKKLSKNDDYTTGNWLNYFLPPRWLALIYQYVQIQVFLIKLILKEN